MKIVLVDKNWNFQKICEYRYFKISKANKLYADLSSEKQNKHFCQKLKIVVQILTVTIVTENNVTTCLSVHKFYLLVYLLMR